jgi:ketosteroid isomerase-like protein
VVEEVIRSDQESNIEVIRRVMEAHRRGDVNAVLEEMDPDVVYLPSSEVSLEPYTGHEGIRRFYEESHDWDEMNYEVVDIRSNDDYVVTLGRFRGRRKGVIRDFPAASVATLRAGKLIRSEGFWDWDSALRAAGLPGA